MTKQTFISEVEEDLDREHKVTLSEGQISTILYVLEGYIQGNDDYDEESVFYQDINNIFKSLEGTIDRFYQRPDLGTDSTTYEDLK
mgnify:FL=1|tara:strand:- start:221 stop:478 length:258 start_codon:yes stop_codon:yes gene_type:complete